jgi:thiol-disulfide isomerase/thioredoxin
MSLEAPPESGALPTAEVTGQPPGGAGGAGGRRRRSFVAGLFVLVLTGAGFVAYAVVVSRSVPTPKYANVVIYASPATAPGFDLVSLEGKGRVTSALIGHGPAVVNWFQSSCVACQAELGTFASVADAERAKVHFVGIDINDPSASAALAMVRRARAEYPVGQAPGLASISLATRFGVGDLPDTVFVSPSGRILGEVLGKVPRAELFAILGNLVAGRPLNS